jgi:hypothetical protein
MMGNYRVRFLGGGGAAMPPRYPTPLENTLSVVIRRDVRIVFFLRVLPTAVTYGGSL